ncbi:hypothetical protein [Enterovibrio coralii]|uniref:Cyclic di-GMP-binding protein n=1 Tax=Enterovibrio coralii TaxID=294935 RepID=A0A135ICN8_9GAMM|nr:hypothetical protein [Enterovibrio coralii]KXF83104.1 hypothetical protein ATN88_05155 [Enterovibrio coralii]
MNKFATILLFFLSTYAVAEKTAKVPLAYATDSQNDIVLRGQSQTVTVPIFILDGQEVESVRLSLSIYNNNAIDKSVLWIAAGNRTLANVEIKQRNQHQMVEMTIPSELLPRIEPSLDLRIQHLSNDPNLVIDTTTLSTTISAQHSSYTLNYIDNGQTRAQTLSSFDEMVRSGQHHDAPVHIVSVLKAEPDATLGIAASLVQGWTLKSGSKEYHYDYQMNVNANASLEGPTIVFGTRDDLLATGWIGEPGYQDISGPYLATVGEGSRWVLLLSGVSERDVKRATKVFTNNVRRLPDRASWVVNDDDDVVDRSLKSNSTYLLSEFTSQTDLTDSPLELDLIMPSNIIFSSEDNAKINLLLTHSRVAPGAGSMILRVNGEYANSLPLRSSYWRDTQHYRLNIPMRDFKPGINKVSVEIYGPVDIQNQQRRFAVYMSDKSNLRLSEWVKFIPTEDHDVSPLDFYAISDDCGKQAQLTVDPADKAQLENLWRLISHVSHSTKKAMPGLLVTTDKQQKRPFHVLFGEDVPKTPFFDEVRQDSRWAVMRQQLFSFVAASEIDDITSDAVPNTAGDMAYVKHTNDRGWYRIHMLDSTEDEFASFLRNEHVKPPSGVLSEREFSSNSSQFLKAAFIGYPAALAAIALILIWWISGFVTRYLEARLWR